MVRFHVVNSVKGGCGKSTFSLYLANYLTAQKHKVVIIDLDIGGSTWYRDFRPHLVNETEGFDDNGKDVDFSIEKTKFLNDLFYEYEKNKTRKHIFELNVRDVIYEQTNDNDNQESEEKKQKKDGDQQVADNETQAAEGDRQKTENEKQISEKMRYIIKLHEGDTRKLNVIMTDPQRASCIRDEELDLLEGAICSLVDEIAIHTYPYNSDVVIDLIFDMPPGYEEHSEHILMHALMDLGSDLYKKYTSKKDKEGKYKNPVYLYMISVVKPSALKANIQYVERFYHSSSYSVDIGVLNAKNVFFILNDADAIFAHFIEMKGQSLQNEGKNLIENIKLSNNINHTGIQACFIKHIHIALSEQTYNNMLNKYNNKSPSPYLLIEETDGFKDRFEEMKHLVDTKEKG